MSMTQFWAPAVPGAITPNTLSSSALSLNLAYLSSNSLFDLFNGRAQLSGPLNWFAKCCLFQYFSCQIALLEVGSDISHSNCLNYNLRRYKPCITRTFGGKSFQIANSASQNSSSIFIFHLSTIVTSYTLSTFRPYKLNIFWKLVTPNIHWPTNHSPTRSTQNPPTI